MINLLPPKQKQALAQETKFRLTLILGTLFVYFLTCISLMFVLVKTYGLWNLQEQEILVEEKEKLISLNQDLEKEIKEANGFLSGLNSFYDKSLGLTEIVQNVYQTIPDGIYLASLDFAAPKTGSKDKPKIAISGFCPDRETLLTFQENLKKQPQFSEVEFSPKSWVEPVNVEFSVNFKIAN